MRKDSAMDEWRINRRTVLQGAAATGVGLAGLSGLSGAAAANGNGKGGYDPCEGCGALLAKYEWADPDGDGEYEFVFEKGRDTFINGDEFEITITATNEDGEPTCVSVESITAGGVDGKIYDFTCSTVKAGTETASDTYNWVSSAELCSPTDKAISNFALCIDQAFFQVDMGKGPVPDFMTEDWSTATLYDSSNYIGATYEDLSGVTTVGPKRFVENAGKSNFWQFNGDGTVTVEFNVLGDDPMDLHVVSTEMPGPWERDEIPWAGQVDLVRDTFDPDENPHSITVQLPTV